MTPNPEQPFRIAVLGNFSGTRAGEERVPLRAVRIDRDDFEAVMRRLAPTITLQLASGAAPVVLSFSELDDFEPDRIYETLELFRELRSVKDGLGDPATFAATARGLTGTPQRAEPVQPTDAAPEAAPDDLLSATIEATKSSPTAPGSGSKLVDDLVREVMRPYVQPGPDPRQAELVGAVDAAIAETLRSVLHHPDFQALEAAWRGLFLLVRRLRTDASLQLWVIDVRRDELDRALGSHTDPVASELGRLLVEETVQTPGGVPWSLLVGDYDFGPTVEDVVLLGRLATLAELAGAPFVAAADPLLVGCEALGVTPDPTDWKEPDSAVGEVWQTLRDDPRAAYLALTLPRFLLRSPYGQGSVPVERFAFEELGAEPDHEHYLWGGSAYLVALALGKAFEESGWELDPTRVCEIDGLPLHVRDTDEGPETKPCAEILLVERGAERANAQGLTTVWSIRGRDAVQIGSLRALSTTPRPLAGAWS